LSHSCPRHIPHAPPQLAAEARRLFPREAGALSITWGRELAGIDFDRRVARFTVRPPAAYAANGNGSRALSPAPMNGGGGAPEEQDVAYDLIVGADGANSKMREIMEANVKGFKAHTLLNSDKTYKTFLLPEAEGAAAVPGLASDPPRRHLYVWGQRGGGGKAPRVVLYKRGDGHLAGMVTEEVSSNEGSQ
jgi:hypothetical protein